MDTIAAISTPVGEAGIGVVRISGPEALQIADTIFKGKIKPSSTPTHTVHYGKVINPDTKREIDEVLLVVMREPHTYTCEDMVEINTHGGVVVLNKVLDLVLKHGARYAEHGEFTRRAFLAGRIDLAQAEAVLDIVKAKTDKSLSIAIAQLDGELSQQINRIKEKLIEIETQIEASIDFPDDVDEVGAIHELPLQEINELLKSSESGRLIREGMTISIVGRTNVGKSSLFNAIIAKDRAIVTPYPGTTRDTIEEWISVDGIPIKLVDTAGVRDSPNPIEQEGVKRTRKAIDEAGLILFVIDQSDGVLEEDIEMLRLCSSQPDKQIIGILNKCDLPPAHRHESRVRISHIPLLSVSALRGDNVELILPTIAKFISVANTVPVVSKTRHIDALRRTKLSIERVQNGVGKMTAELISYELREAINALGEITGEFTTEALLDRIFSEFCIGK